MLSAYRVQNARISSLTERSEGGRAAPGRQRRRWSAIRQPCGGRPPGCLGAVLAEVVITPVESNDGLAGRFVEAV